MTSGAAQAPSPTGAALGGRTWPIAAALAAGAVLTLGLDRLGGPGGAPSFSAIPDVLRGTGAATLLFGACGYAPARLLLGATLRPHLALLVLPIGAAVSSIALTLLGVFRVPLGVSLAAVILSGIAAAAVLHARGVPGAPTTAREAAGPRSLRLLWPAAIALVMAAMIASPQLRADSLATVLGANGDAHLATGSALLLQEAPPGAVRPELPVDHMPQVWRSKYPIYYVLAGVSTLSGLDPVQAFSTLIAIVAALAVLGLFLVAFHVAGASAGAALSGMAFVAVDRAVADMALAPFYNQVWGLFSIPFVLLFGWRFLWEPSRAAFGLLVLFATLLGLAYPLLVPFPALFLAITAVLVWRRRRSRGQSVGWLSSLRLPRSRRSMLLWVPLALVVAPVALLFALAAFEKMQAATLALLPGGNLAPWTGDAIGFFSLTVFLGLPDGWPWLAAVAAVLALVALGLRAGSSDGRLALGGMVGALALVAGWLWVRGEGSLFHFRALTFFAPFALVMAGVGAAWLVGRAEGTARVAAVCAIGALCAVLAVETRTSLRAALPHASAEVWELRSWSGRIPAGASIRVDVTPTGVQQWADYMLAAHPLSASDPLREFFPHPPVGRKADYLLVNSDVPRPLDASGPPRLSNRRFSLYRIDPDLPGPDVSSRRMVDPPPSVTDD